MLALDISPVDDVCIVDLLPEAICVLPIEAYFFFGAVTSTVVGVDVCVT